MKFLFNLFDFFNTRVEGKQRKYLIFLVILLLFYTRFIRYVEWNPTYAGWVSNILILFIFFYYLFKIKRTNVYNFKTEVLLLTFLPFLSIINSWFLYGQSPIIGFKVTMINFIWLLYFIYHKLGLKENTILKAFIYISILILSIQVIQQFTYPNVFFGVSKWDDVLAKGGTEIAESRNGLWRFRMHFNSYFTAPVLFALLMLYRSKPRRNLFVMTLLLFLSVYLTLTRQVMFAIILTVFLSFFLGKSKINYSYVAFGVILLMILYSNYDLLFGELTTQTKDEFNDDNIRLLAGTYFMERSLESPMTFLLGYGDAGGGAYAAYMEYLKEVLSFYTVDVGFIGMLFTYGFIYVFVCYRVLYKLFIKYKRITPLYIRMFTLFTVIMSPMIFPMAGTTSCIIWTLLLYIVDLHLTNSSLSLEQTKI